MSRPASLRRGENGFDLGLPGGPAAASTARHALGQLPGDFDEALMGTMRLLVTELVTNSVRHARAHSISIKAAVRGSSIWLEVSDEGPGFDIQGALDEAGHSDESGWGLFLVQQLANRWGVRREDGATNVWLELQR
jgi:anti-sigma regulatory factor (Ser/Thr protein kinase)